LQVRVTARERYRLVRLAKPRGVAIRDLVTIVKPGTLMRWIKATDTKRKPKPTTRKPGGPRTPENIRQIVLRIARDTGVTPVRQPPSSELFHTCAMSALGEQTEIICFEQIGGIADSEP